MFENLDDPKRQALLALAAGLLSPVRSKGWSGFGEALGQGIQGGLLGFNQAQRTKEATDRGAMARKLQEMQFAEMERAQKFNQAAFKPGIGAQPLTPNDDNGFPMPSPEPRFDYAAAAQIDPMKAFQLNRQINPQPQVKQPEYKVVGNRLVKIDEAGASEAYAPPQEQKDWQNPDYQAWKLRERAAGRSNVTTNVNAPSQTFSESMKLKKDFDDQPEVKGFKEVRSAWDQISTALAKPSAANDMAAATKFMKLLDPGSVVRESELMMAMQASGVLDRMANYHKRLMSGEKLTPTQRQDFYQSGKALYEAARGRYNQTAEQYEGLAKKYDLDPTFIYRPKEKLTRNQTATAKARMAIKSGAPKDQVIRRMIEEGFDPEGL